MGVEEGGGVYRVIGEKERRGGGEGREGLRKVWTGCEEYGG